MLVRSSFRLALLCTLLCPLGCGSEEPLGVCNELANDGPEVTPEFVTAGTTPMGGTIVEGTYELTSYDFFPDEGATITPAASSYSGVFVFSSGSLQAVTGNIVADEERSGHVSAAYAASGTELTLAYSCPDDTIVEQPQFTATESELRLYYRIANDTGTLEATLTKR